MCARARPRAQRSYAAHFVFGDGDAVVIAGGDGGGLIMFYAAHAALQRNTPARARLL